MIQRHTAESLHGLTIDAHSHAGVWLKAYAGMEYPYAATIEGLYYRQRSADIDVNIVFPYSADLYFDPHSVRQGNLQPSDTPLSEIPFAVENELLLREVYDYCPELSHRFLPFLCIDPSRDIHNQVGKLRSLTASYPVYGLKVNATITQSNVTDLMAGGSLLLDLAEEMNWPLLYHASSGSGSSFSSSPDILETARQRPNLRFILAHSLLFQAHLFDEAAAIPNVWVDTSALKIQLELAWDLVENGSIKEADLLVTRQHDHCNAMQIMCSRHPEMIIWGTDAPAYAFICQRVGKSGGQPYFFRLKGTYEDEVKALRALSPRQQSLASNKNTLAFLFGTAGTACKSQNNCPK